MDVAALMARVAQVDAAVATQAEVVAALADVARVKAWLTALEVSLLHRLHDAGDGDGDGADDVAVGDAVEVVAAATRCGRRDAARAMEHAEVAALVPGFTQALRDGRTTPVHLQTLTSVLRRVPREHRALVASCAERLVSAACTSSPERFARAARAVVAQLDRAPRAVRLRRQRAASWVRTWTDAVSGMTVIHGELDPVNGLRVAAALECTIEDRYRGRIGDERLDLEVSRDHLRARALVALVRGGRRHLHERDRRRDAASVRSVHPALAPPCIHPVRAVSGTPTQHADRGHEANEHTDRDRSTEVTSHGHPTRAPCCPWGREHGRDAVASDVHDGRARPANNAAHRTPGEAYVTALSSVRRTTSAGCHRSSSSTVLRASTSPIRRSTRAVVKSSTPSSPGGGGSVSIIRA